MRQEQEVEAEKRVSDGLIVEEKAKKPTFKYNKAYSIIKKKIDETKKWFEELGKGFSE